NPWQQHFADAEVRKIIRQDVERTFPDVEFFRDDAVQNQMTDVLFIYCKLNADVSYRQGMHELLAPIFLVLNTEGVDIGDGSLVGPADTKLMAQVLDKKYLEHDSYALFERLMSGAKKWYEFNDESCRRIQHQLLKSTDPALYQHLETLGIEPQLYGIRWIRLLFGREFSIENVLELWDAIFAEDPSLNIVEYICLVLLLRIRDKMVDGEYAECLTLLMRYPPIKEPVTCVEQAKYLRQNLTEEACLQILRQNDVKAGKPPRESIGPERPVDPRQRRANHASGLPSDGISKLTKDMMQNPQIREINRALVGVMGAVQKNMNTFGENVLGKSGPDMNNAARPPPKATPAKAKPPMAHRVNKPLPSNTQYNDLVDNLHEVNSEMGQLLAKCVNVLERELFPDIVDEEKASEGEPQEGPKPPMKEEASVIMALVGIKHVRDVLLGKQRELDLSV
ncbi:rab-GTPase-TBC domain-containing protein, partial [Umbelopsis sp. AD052]